jgi:galactoside O-acetyltransferase
MTVTYAPEELGTLGLRRVGADVHVHRTVLFFNPQGVTIGDHCRIDAFSIITGSDAGVTIGRHVHIASGAYLFGGGGIDVHDFAGISARTIVYSTNDDYSGAFLTGPTIPDDLTNVVRHRVVVGRHVVIGAGSILLPGVTIGEGSAVGALSLIKHDVDPFTIVAGNPARRVGPRARHLLELEAELTAREQAATKDDR